MKIYFDGSCGPKNPGGYACYAFVIIEEGKEVIQKTGIECQGEGATNNVAEYAGLLHALEFLIENKNTGSIEIYGDSKLVINQVNGDWRCKQEHLQKLLDKVHECLDKFFDWTAGWVPRDQNSLADGLSKWETVLDDCD